MDNASRFVQRNLYGFPIREPEPPPPSLIHAAFDGMDVRITLVKGEPWWVAKDVCRVLGIANHHHAVQGNPGRDTPALDEDERGMHIVTTPSGDQKMLCVNESGLYSLIFRSRKPEAKRFRKWVTSEVLPAIRKTGTYSLRSPRVSREARRLKVDSETAEVRCRQFEENKSWNRRLADRGYKPTHIAGAHNAVYVGQCGQKAAVLRKQLGLRPGQTPLDRMGSMPLAANLHIKTLADATILSMGGSAIPIENQLAIMQDIASQMSEMHRNKLQNGYHVDLTDHPKRGMIIDVVPSKLIAV